MVDTSSPFGGQTRTRLLLALRLLEESYPRELARLLERPLQVIVPAESEGDGEGEREARM